VAIEFEESDRELALVTWLNLLLGKARELGMIFSCFQLQCKGTVDRRGPGEEWNQSLSMVSR
jgi:hypothetical protein